MLRDAAKLTWREIEEFECQLFKLEKKLFAKMDVDFDYSTDKAKNIDVIFKRIFFIYMTHEFLRQFFVVVFVLNDSSH